MKKRIVLVILAFIFLGFVNYTLFSCNPQPAPETVITHTLLSEVDSLAASKNELLAAVNNGATDARLQQLFLQTRAAYKKIEWAVEYFAPVVSRFVNGPPVEEVDIMDKRVQEPAGLQVIEGYLYPKYDSANKKALIAQLNSIQYGCDKYASYLNNIPLLDWQVFDAAKLQVFRVLTLGITGFDDPLSVKSIPESATSLQSVRQAMRHYCSRSDSEKVIQKLDVAIAYMLFGEH